MSRPKPFTHFSSPTRTTRPTHTRIVFKTERGHHLLFINKIKSNCNCTATPLLLHTVSATSESFYIVERAFTIPCWYLSVPALSAIVSQLFPLREHPQTRGRQDFASALKQTIITRRPIPWYNRSRWMFCSYTSIRSVNIFWPILGLQRDRVICGQNRTDNLRTNCILDQTSKCYSKMQSPNY